MVNILIVDDNLNYAIQLMNYINTKNNNIKVISIAENGKKALNILNSRQDIDIILLDLKMPICTGNELISSLGNNDRYNNSIIVISGEIENIRQLHTSNMIYSILYKSIDMNGIIYKINELVKVKNTNKKESRIKDKIINEVLELNYDISNVGTQYLINAIEYILINMPNKEFNKLQTEVYPFVAKFNSTSVHNVKNNIVRATNKMYYQCEIEKLKKYFCYSNDIKPDTRTVIRTIINKVS